MKALLVLLLTTAYYSVCSAEPSMGRLFHSPEERAQLDSERLKTTRIDSQQSPVLTIDGEVRRSSGKDSHWINGAPQDGRSKYEAAIGDSIDMRSGKKPIPLINGKIETTPRRR